MAKEVHQRDVVVLLRNDVKLAKEWKFLYHNLHLMRDDTFAIERLLNQTNCPFELMNEIVGQLVSEKGSDATIRVLADALVQTQHVFIKDVLLEKFPAEAKIVSFKFEGKTDGKDADNNTAPALTKEDKLIQKKTSSGGITILQIVKNKEDDNGKLMVVISHLLTILSKIGSRQVAIISINGTQRSGKSFLANQFVKFLKYGDEGGTSWLDKELESNFEWRGSYERVTSGIQIWHEPLFVKHNGEEIGVIFLDTQGLHDKSTGSQGDSVIFGVSVLLSSVFIYNERQVAEDALQYLRSYLELAKFATGENDGSSNSERLTFQKLICLIRDFEADEYMFGYYDDTNCPSGQTKNLKQAIFGLSPGISAEAKDTRMGIESCFEETGVYAMSGPGRKLPNKPEYVNSQDWEPEFRSSVVDFVTKVCSPEALFASTKRVFGQLVTAEHLKAYVSKWVQLIQETEGMVGSKTIFDSTAETFYNSKIDESLQDYKNKMIHHLEQHPYGVGDCDLNNYSSLFVISVEANFCNERSLGGASMREIYKKKLRERINGVKEEFFVINEANKTAAKERELREKDNIEAKRREEQLTVEAKREKDELERQKAEAKQKTIQNAHAHYQQALNDFHISEGKVQNVITNQQNYKRPVNKRQHNKLWGLIPAGYTRWVEHVYDDELYQKALQEALAEKQKLQQRVNEAEHELNAAKNS